LKGVVLQDNKVQILQVTWQGPWQHALKQLREVVFIAEQSVPVAIEWDDEDATAIHLLALDATQTPVACARILPRGRIGRMAVLNSHRGSGIGMALLQQALKVCHEMGMQQVSLSAQTHAIQFYERAGFKVTSEAYIDANIWHVEMELELV
jgi:predicted GNAT family N-acyltransferase